MIRKRLSRIGVLELVIDRPPVNAFDIGLLESLSEILRTQAARDNVRAVVLRAQGRGFCGGGDVKEVQALTGFDGILGQAAGALEASLAVLNCRVPVICAVHNYCVGVGVLIAGCSDILLATPGARFVLAEVDNGATAGAVQALRLMPEARLRAAMMTAEPVMAEELHALGSVYRLSAPDRIAADAMTVAATIASKSAPAMRRLKRSLNGTTKAAEIEALYRAELSYTYELNIMGEAAAGRSAFITGKRKSYLKPRA